MVTEEFQYALNSHTLQQIFEFIKHTLTYQKSQMMKIEPLVSECDTIESSAFPPAAHQDFTVSCCQECHVGEYNKNGKKFESHWQYEKGGQRWEVWHEAWHQGFYLKLMETVGTGSAHFIHQQCHDPPWLALILLWTCAFHPNWLQRCVSSSSSSKALLRKGSLKWGIGLRTLRLCGCIINLDLLSLGE